MICVLKGSLQREQNMLKIHDFDIKEIYLELIHYKNLIIICLMVLLFGRAQLIET